MPPDNPTLTVQLNGAQSGIPLPGRIEAEV
jgi:hypothetical protein